MNIPDWADVANRIENGEEYSPLDWFVYHNEPAGDADESEFRTQLQAALEYVCKQGRAA